MSVSIPRILLLDDDLVLLHGLSDMLTYHLQPAVVAGHASSSNVEAQVREGQYDVVICDLKMPGQGGLHFLAVLNRVINERLKQIKRAVRKILAYSAGPAAY